MVLAAAGLLAQAQDVWPTKGWTSATPEWQGMDSGALDALVEFGRANQTDGLLVTRHGRIVLDAYYAPFEDNQLHAINSATKAITAALVGIAIARRELPPPDTPVLELATKRMVANVDERKRALKLQNLLGMDSGIAWIEPLAASPMTPGPGAEYRYANGWWTPPDRGAYMAVGFSSTRGATKQDSSPSP